MPIARRSLRRLAAPPSIFRERMPSRFRTDVRGVADLDQPAENQLVVVALLHERAR